MSATVSDTSCAASVGESQAELDVPRLVRLGIGELAEGRARQPRRETSQEMPIRKIERRAAELQVPPLAAEREGFTDRQILVQLHRLAELRDGGREIAVDGVWRLHERVLVEVRAGLTSG